MFTLAISCLTTFNLPWFMDLSFQVPMQYCSLQHWTLLPPPNTNTTGCYFHFGSASSFLLELFPCSSIVALSIIYLFTWSTPLYVATATQAPFYSRFLPHPPRTSTSCLVPGCPGQTTLQGGHSFLLAYVPTLMPGCCFCGYFPLSTQSTTRSH